MEYNPLAHTEIPVGERTLFKVAGSVKTLVNFMKGHTQLDNFIEIHKPMLDELCHSVLHNVLHHPQKRYRISIEGRGQSSGESTLANIQLAVMRARFVRDKFHEYLLNFKEGSYSIRDMVINKRLYIRVIDVLPYYDQEKGKTSWTDGTIDAPKYQRGKVNVYYESKSI
ncbi:hypothetical protein V6R21_25610 [Limibacter armeniacum]|uniref:hypothetical protein n=1 Tax=Limibacter armeniacum TaxID=466084 RepID=UPI002FE594D8